MFYFNDVVFLTGEQVRHISRDHVSDVRYHNGQLFCLSGKAGRAEIQVYDTRTWERIRNIHSPCKCSHAYNHTLHIGSEHITLTCGDTHIIHTMTHRGEHVQTTKNGSGIGEFVHPFICHNSSDAVLVGDFANARLQLRHAGEWSRMLLEPQPLWPLDAVYIGGALFVLCHDIFGENDRIIKYTPT